jgi:single-strand DNA-binding protein
MGSVNRVTLLGNLARDPEVRHTQDGKPIVNLTVATSESWKDKATGERKEKAEFHRVVIFNEGLAKVAEAYLKKGSSVYLEGQLQTRKWMDKDGVEKYSTEIVLQQYRGELVLLGSKDGTSDRPEQKAQKPVSRGHSDAGLDATLKHSVKKFFNADLDDDLPPF